MRELPILFNAAMVRATLEDRKTQTRRVVKPPKGWKDQFSHCDPFAMPPAVWWWNGVHERVGVRQECPYGLPGDRLWVRETFQIVSNYHADCRDQQPPFDDGRPVVRHDDPVYPYWKQCYYAATEACPELLSVDTDEFECKWCPSIHMPRWASRILLEVVSVRVERLQDISEQDAKTEGCTSFRVKGMGEFGARSAFKDLWESINGADSWDVNPWVWVIEFTRVQP